MITASTLKTSNRKAKEIQNKQKKGKKKRFRGKKINETEHNRKNMVLARLGYERENEKRETKIKIPTPGGSGDIL